MLLAEQQLSLSQSVKMSVLVHKITNAIKDSFKSSTLLNTHFTLFKAQSNTTLNECMCVAKVLLTKARLQKQTSPTWIPIFMAINLIFPVQQLLLQVPQHVSTLLLTHEGHQVVRASQVKHRVHLETKHKVWILCAAICCNSNYRCHWSLLNHGAGGGSSFDDNVGAVLLSL